LKIGFDVRKIRDTGIGTYIRNILGAMFEIESDNEYVLFGYPGDSQVIPFPRERVTWVVNNAGKYSVMEHVSLPWEARRAKVDVFHSPHYTLPLLISCPSVVTIHDLIHMKFPEYLPTGFHRIYAGMMARSAAKRARITLTGSHNSKEDIVSLLGVPEDRVRVIHYGVADNFFTVPGTFEDPKGYILIVSSPKPHKNLEGAVRAYSLIADRVPYDLRVVGERPGADSAVCEFISKQGLEERIRFLGTVDDEELRRTYAGALVMLCLSRYEGFGLTVLEAMASGVPVVLSAVSSHPEVAGDSAILVDPEDHLGASAAIMNLVSNEDERQKYIRKGLERAKSFSWRDAAEKTLECYREAELIP